MRFSSSQKIDPPERKSERVFAAKIFCPPAGKKSIRANENVSINDFLCREDFLQIKERENEISLYFYAVGESIEMRFANKQEIDWPNEFPRPARRFQNFPVLLQPA